VPEQSQLSSLYQLDYGAVSFYVISYTLYTNSVFPAHF